MSVVLILILCRKEGKRVQEPAARMGEKRSL